MSINNFPIQTRIFIGNLDFNITKDQIYNAFSPFGNIIDEVRIHSGFAFVQFDSEEACRKAISAMSGATLGTKKLDVQMAKGPNHSAKQGSKRKNYDQKSSRGSSSNDRNSNNRTKKTKRQSSPPRDSQPLTIPTVSTISPYSTAYSLSIYIPDQSLENYANYVLQVLKSNGLAYYNIQIRNTQKGEFFFNSPQFYQMTALEKFVIVIKKVHELNRNVVSFKATMPDGTSPGFADTSISDVCSFIVNNPAPAVVTANPTVPLSIYQQYPTIPSYPTTTSMPTTTTMIQTNPQTNPPRYNVGSGGSSITTNIQSNPRSNRSKPRQSNSNNNAPRGSKYQQHQTSSLPTSSSVTPSQSYNPTNPSLVFSGLTSLPQTGATNASGETEVKGLILKLLDTINKKTSVSNTPPANTSNPTTISNENLPNIGNNANDGNTKGNVLSPVTTTTYSAAVSTPPTPPFPGEYEHGDHQDNQEPFLTEDENRENYNNEIHASENNNNV
ncbi:hypothetical protein ABK040_000206 [Willaertia magna]